VRKLSFQTKSSAVKGRFQFAFHKLLPLITVRTDFNSILADISFVFTLVLPFISTRPLISTGCASDNQFMRMTRPARAGRCGPAGVGLPSIALTRCRGRPMHPAFHNLIIKPQT
jgi:hypothetical protein